MGINESVEAYDAAIGIVNDIADKKEDDGKIDKMEMLQVAVYNAPASVRAVMGAEGIPAEWQDLDKEETKILLDKSLELLKAFGRLFGMNKAV
jgi:hypothetical protein